MSEASSQRDLRPPRDVPPAVAAWMTRAKSDAVAQAKSEAVALTKAYVAEYIESKTADVVELVTKQTRDRLTGLKDGLLHQIRKEVAQDLKLPMRGLTHKLVNCTTCKHA